MIDFICMESAEVLWTGRGRKIHNENILSALFAKWYYQNKTAVSSQVVF